MNRRSFIAAAGALAFGATLGTAMRAFAQQNPMQITAIEPLLLKGNKCFVRVRTSADVTGYGEVSPMNSAASAYLIEHTYAPLLTGMNPLDIGRCWDKAYYSTYKQGVMGLQPETIAGIDIALWDILGKVAGLPVSTLLGGRRRDSVRVYASIGGGAGSTPEQMAKRAEKALSQGFTAVKIPMDYGPVEPDANVKKDLETLATVRKAIGDQTQLLYDVNNGYTVQTAIRVGKEIERFNVIHYEEPVAQTDYEGYAKVVDAVDIPVAVGEHEYTRWQFRDLIEQANPDILQPDLVKCAGISEAVKIATLASAHNKLLCPHQTQPTIGQAATLHYVSVFVPNDMAQEFESGGPDSPLRELFKNPPEFKDGRLTVPTGPGLGLEVDEARLEAMKA